MNEKARTLKTLFIPNKKSLLRGFFNNGAAIVTISEPPKLFYIIENQESKELLRRMSDLLAA